MAKLCLVLLLVVNFLIVAAQKDDPLNEGLGPGCNDGGCMEELAPDVQELLTDSSDKLTVLTKTLNKLVDVNNANVNIFRSAGAVLKGRMQDNLMKMADMFSSVKSQDTRPAPESLPASLMQLQQSRLEKMTSELRTEHSLIRREMSAVRADEDIEKKEARLKILKDKVYEMGGKLKGLTGTYNQFVEKVRKSADHVSELSKYFKEMAQGLSMTQSMPRQLQPFEVNYEDVSPATGLSEAQSRAVVSKDRPSDIKAVMSKLRLVAPIVNSNVNTFNENAELVNGASTIVEEVGKAFLDMYEHLIAHEQVTSEVADIPDQSSNATSSI